MRHYYVICCFDAHTSRPLVDYHEWKSHMKHSRSEGHYFNINEKLFLFPKVSVNSELLFPLFNVCKSVMFEEKIFLPWELSCVFNWKVISLPKKSYYCYILNNQWLVLNISSKVFLAWADPFCLFLIYLVLRMCSVYMVLKLFRMQQ